MRKFLKLKEDREVSYDIKSRDVLFFLSGLIIFSALSVYRVPEEILRLVLFRGGMVLLFLLPIISNIIMLTLLRRVFEKKDVLKSVYIIGVFLFVISLIFLKYDDLIIADYLIKRGGKDEDMPRIFYNPFIFFHFSHSFFAIIYSVLALLYVFLPEKGNIQKITSKDKIGLFLSGGCSINITLFLSVLMLVLFSMKKMEVYISEFVSMVFK